MYKLLMNVNDTNTTCYMNISSTGPLIPDEIVVVVTLDSIVVDVSTMIILSEALS